MWNIDTTWTLFLDRDGVINTRKMGGYIEEVEEFVFLPGTLDAIKKCASIFGNIVVVTNQQGIGKGIMTEEQLQSVHQFMLEEVANHGGRIDTCYFAPDLAHMDSDLRKPKSGMGHLAKADYPTIDFSKSIMVGDSDSDIEFGMNLGMRTVRIGGENSTPKAEIHVESLEKFVNQL